MNTMFVESNPAPMKAALARIGLITNELRLPLCPITAASNSQLEKDLAPFLAELIPG
jgi:4-hydroxy-tetrahydrodipicolinate synthase